MLVFLGYARLKLKKSLLRKGFGFCWEIGGFLDYEKSALDLVIIVLDLVFFALDSPINCNF